MWSAPWPAKFSFHSASVGVCAPLISSIDRDGTKLGYDLEVTRLISESVSIPVIASGGAGEPTHLYDAFTAGAADAALVASIVHYGEYPIPDLKKYLMKRQIEV